MLKRSGFKNKGKWKGFKKSTKDLRRAKFGATRLKVRSKAKKRVIPQHKRIKTLKTKLWEHCKRIIRAKYGNTCFTCGKTGLVGSSQHTGHFIPSSVGGVLLRYNLDNLRIQDYYCNINCGGQGAIFYQKLLEEKGQSFIDELFELKKQSIKADELWYTSKIEEYEKL